MMENVYIQSIPHIQWIQQNLEPFHQFFFTVASLADPGTVVTVIFPILYCLKPSFGRRILWGIIIAEWINLNLKWFLHDHRPFWWVMETSVYVDNASRPHLQQYPGTCETGSGSPSGHGMSMATAGVILCYQGVKELRKITNMSRNFDFWVRLLLWSTFLFMLIAIDLARVFVATHFPHQAILGNVLGIITGYVIVRFPVSKFSFSQYMQWTLVIGISTALNYIYLINTSYDPNWSVELATKWCANADWLRPSTRPFCTVSRVLGAVFGLGLGVGITDNLIKGGPDQALELSRRVKSACVPVAIVVAMALEHAALPQGGILEFYALSFLKMAGMVFLVSGILPNIFTVLLDESYEPGTKINEKEKRLKTANT